MDDLITERLIIRPFVAADAPVIRAILNAAFSAADTPEDIASWVTWSALSARWLPAMYEPPYGDRAVVLRATGELIGAVGYVPLLMPFDCIPELSRSPGPSRPDQVTPEFGLFWATDPPRQRQGYASEAAGALIDYAFDRLKLWRIVATTKYENTASQAVMRRLGMTLTRNPHPRPEWLQVVGVRYAEPRAVQEGLLT